MAGSQQMIDARPVIASSAQSPWTDAENQRDALADAMEAALKDLNLRALVVRSQPGVYPATLQLVAWSPQDESDSATVTKRDELKISIDVNPYLQNPILYRIDIAARNRRISKSRWRLSEADAKQLAAYAVGNGPVPEILKGDLARSLVGLIPFGALMLDRNELIKSARPSRLTVPNALIAGGGLIGLFGGMSQSLLVLPGLAAIVVGAMWSMRRPRLYANVKRPELAPRRLFLVDSWQTSVPDVGPYFSQLVSRIERAVNAVDPAIGARWENHQYRTPYGFESRSRLTLTKGQAVVHLHIYPFANDAFVGWDGYMNWARWAETEAVSTNVRDGKRVDYRSLAVGPHIPNDFDLVELNALCELVHRRIVTEIKALLKEKQIEAEIDFSIIRGNRENALKAGQGAKSGGGAIRDWRKPAGE
jgi:hypothetical protein